MKSAKDLERRLPRRGKTAPKPDSVVEVLWTRFERWLTRSIKLSVLIGTLVALIYFLKIHSMPLDGLSSLAGLTGAVAFVTLGLFAAFIALWGAPSLAFQASIDIAPLSLTSWFLKQRTQFEVNTSEVPLISWRRTWWWCFARVGAPWLALYAVTIPSAFGGLQWSRAIAIAVGVYALIEATYFASMPASRSKPQSEDKTPKPALGMKLFMGRFAFAIGYTGVSVYPLFAYLKLVSLSSYGNVTTPIYVTILVLLSIAVVVGTNALAIVFIIVGRRRPLVSSGAILIIVVGSFVGVITALGIWGGLLDQVMGAVSIRVPHAQLVLAKSACQSFELTGLKMPITASAPSGAGDNCTLQDVTILSRVGARWPIACSDETPELKWPRRLLLKAEDVISVTTPASAVSATPAAAFSVVSFCDGQRATSTVSAAASAASSGSASASAAPTKSAASSR